MSKIFISLITYTLSMEDTAADINSEVGTKYETKIAQYMYNCFVDNKNFKTNLVLSPSEITQGVVALSAEKNSNVNEQYSLIVGNKMLYDWQIINVMDLEINVINVQTAEDQKMCMVGEYNAGTVGENPHMLTLGYTEQIVKGSLIDPTSNVDSQLGVCNPCAPGIFGLNSDVINKKFRSLRIGLGFTGCSIETGYTPAMIDILNRFLPETELNKYDNIRRQDEIPNYEDITSTYSIPYKKRTSYYSYVMGPWGDVGSYFPKLQEVNHVKGTTIEEINQNYFASLGALQRGKIFFDKERFSVVFTKSIASPNYTWVTAAGGLGGFIATSVSKDLFTYWINGVPYPSNITNADAADIICKTNYAALWYANKKNQHHFFNVMTPGNFTAAARVSVGFEEPVGQLLNISMKIKDVAGPLLHPLCHSQTGKSSFTNLTNVTIGGDYNGPLSKYLIKYSRYMVDNLLTDWTAAMPTSYKLTTLDQMTVTIPKTALHYKIYHLPQTLSTVLQPVTTVPFYRHYSQHNTINQTNKSRVWQSAPQILTETPKFVVLTASKNLDISNNVSDENRHRIKSLGISIDDNPDIMITRKEIDMMNITMQNGLHNYSERNYKGHAVFTPELQTGASSFMPVTTILASMGLKVQLKGNGTILLLQFGTDIPLSGSGNVAGSNNSMKIQYTIEFEPEAGVDAEKYGVFSILHITEAEVLLSNNVATESKFLFTSTDVSDAIKQFQRRSLGGHLYLKSSTLRGGNWFKSALGHVKSVASRVLPMLQRAGSNFYESNKDQIHDMGRSALQQGASYAQNAASNAGHKTLAGVLQSARSQF